MGASGLACSDRRFPNVVLILCDDLNDSLEGMGGHPQARTPHIRALMQRGVTFGNAHANAPLCAPSRVSLWTGLYPSTTGYYGQSQGENYWRMFPGLGTQPTLMQRFADNGYDVLGTGKVFHHSREDRDQFRRADGRAGYGHAPSFGPYPWDGRSRSADGRTVPAPHPAMPADLRPAAFQGFGPLSMVPNTPPDPKKGTPGYTGWMLYGQPFHYAGEGDRDLMPDELSAAWAAEQFQEARDRPFFLSVGLHRPHLPLYAPKKYFDRFPLSEIQLPPYRKGDLDDVPVIQWQRDKTGERTPAARGLPRLLRAGGVDLWKRWLQAYLACVAFVDDQVGAILGALDASGHAGNTIVVFSSDHGQHMGEKDHLHKRTLWEESTRIPLAIIAPGVSRAGGRCDHPVSLIDVFPTLVDLCNLVDGPDPRRKALAPDGHSLRPLLEDPAGGSWEGPSVALTALFGPTPVPVNTAAQAQDQHFSVRSSRWRYTRYSDGEEELYDHETDPQEWANLAGDPRFDEVRRALRAEMQQLTRAEM